MKLLNRVEWDQFISEKHQAHLLQTSAWGELKLGFNWFPVRLVCGQAGAQVLFRRLPLGFTIAYLPKGPFGENWANLLEAIDQLCHQHHAVFLTIEPDAYEPIPIGLAQQMTAFGSPTASIQPRRTLMVDLHGSESDWLARMSKKTRHAFDYATQNGISAVYSEDIERFIQLMHQTGQRRQFGVHSSAYYHRAYHLFSPTQSCALILAQRQGRTLAGLMVFRHGQRAYYLYGASSGEDRQYNPTYLIQLESMRWAAQHGCTHYDLWGVPDFDLDVLESNFTERKEGLWGVYGYKRKFGGELIRTAGAWQRVYQPALLKAYNGWVKLRGGEVI